MNQQVEYQLCQGDQEDDHSQQYPNSATPSQQIMSECIGQVENFLQNMEFLDENFRRQVEKCDLETQKLQNDKRNILDKVNDLKQNMHAMQKQANMKQGKEANRKLQVDINLARERLEKLRMEKVNALNAKFSNLSLGDQQEDSGIHQYSDKHA